MKNLKTVTVLAVIFAMQFVVATPPAVAQQSPEYELALQRGTQAVIWGLPAVSMKGFCGSMETQLGMKENEDIMVLSQPMVSRHGFLTARCEGEWLAHRQHERAFEHDLFQRSDPILSCSGEPQTAEGVS